MIDSDELLAAIVGEAKVATFKEVKLTSMRLAHVVRQVIAEDLDGTLPSTGKQFLTTRRGLFRLASRPNSDNTTERHAHVQMGAKTVQVFGDMSALGRARGWITVEELYRLHRVKFDPTEMLKKVAIRFRAES
jgi:hypothetical protein